VTREAADSTGRPAGPDWALARKALLVRLRSIGDTVLMTPCLAALKQWRPDIETTVLLEPLSAPLLEGHPLVDKLLVVEKSLASRARLVAALKREGFDVAFDLHGGPTASILASLSGARWTVGYAGYRHSRLLRLRAPAPDRLLGRDSLHSVEQQLALLSWSGVPWPAARPRLSLAVSERALASARSKLSSAGLAETAFAVIAPAAAFESKRWPTGGFAEVADHLKERWDLPGVVIAGPGQEETAREVARKTRSAASVIVGLSLPELAALISQSHVFIGNDSGPMHIAAAFARPIVAVFGSSSPGVWHPWTDSPFKVVGSRMNEQESTSASPENLVKRIPAGEVIAAADDVLKLAPGANHRAGAVFQPGIAG
jgi:ADP-heptose:LPS heptosyltransferase